MAYLGSRLPRMFIAWAYARATARGTVASGPRLSAPSSSRHIGSGTAGTPPRSGSRAGSHRRRTSHPHRRSCRPSSPVGARPIARADQTPPVFHLPADPLGMSARVVTDALRFDQVATLPLADGQDSAEGVRILLDHAPERQTRPVAGHFPEKMLRVLPGADERETCLRSRSPGLEDHA